MYSRRSFTKFALSTAPSLFLMGEAKTPKSLQANEGSKPPSSICGYSLTEEDKVLVAKFLATHEKNLIELREGELPNGLPPSFTPLSLQNNR